MLSDSYVKEVETDTARYLGRVLLMMVCIHGHDGSHWLDRNFLRQINLQRWTTLLNVLSNAPARSVFIAALIALLHGMHMSQG